MKFKTNVFTFSEYINGKTFFFTSFTIILLLIKLCIKLESSLIDL